MLTLKYNYLNMVPLEEEGNNEEDENSLFLELVILVKPSSFSDWLLLMSFAL